MGFRAPWIYVALLTIIIGGSLTLQLRGAWEDSPTRDEPSHLVDGLAYWQLGSFEFNYPHPPLAKMLPGAMLYFSGARIDANGTAWQTQDTEAVNAQVLFTHREWTDSRYIIFLARLPILLFGLTLLLSIWWLVRRQWGWLPALAATTIVAFDPTVIGHGPLVNTDIPVTAMIFLTIILFDRYVRSPRWKKLIVLSIVFALAQVTKFSAVVLWPLLIILGAYWTITHRQVFPWPAWRRMVGTLVIITAAVIVIFYRGEMHTIVAKPTSSPIVQTLSRYHLPIPAFSYWRGLGYNVRLNDAGHPTVFLGQTIQRGDWRYFPVAVLTKTPLPTLALWLATILASIFWLKNLRWKPAARWWVFAAPVIVYAATAEKSHLDLGIRYLLPTLPFLALGVGWLVAKALAYRRQLGVLIATAAFSVVPITLTAWPNMISYFNPLAGGTTNGQHWFVDSNLDWGQDAWHIRQYVDRHAAEKMYVDIFGAIPRTSFAPNTLRVPTEKNVAANGQPSGTVIITSGLLYDPEAPYAWLRSRQPTERIGSTGLVFRLP